MPNKKTLQEMYNKHSKDALNNIPTIGKMIDSVSRSIPSIKVSEDHVWITDELPDAPRPLVSEEDRYKELQAKVDRLEEAVAMLIKERESDRT